MGIGSAIGGGIGWLASGDDRKRAEEDMKRAIGSYDGAVAPDGTPILQGSTAYDSLKMSPEGREAQMRALQNYWRQAQGGPNIEDKAATEAIMEPLANQERAQQGAIMGNFAQRGRSGGGGEMAARMQSASNAANSARASGTSLAAAAYRRAMDANTAAAGLGGAVRGQDYTQMSDLARARDNIAAANASATERARQSGFDNDMRLRNARHGTARESQDYYQGRADDAVGAGQAIGGILDDNIQTGMNIVSGGMAGGGGGGSNSGKRQRKAPPTDYSGY